MPAPIRAVKVMPSHGRQHRPSQCAASLPDQEEKHLKVSEVVLRKLDLPLIKPYKVSYRSYAVTALRFP